MSDSAEVIVLMEGPTEQRFIKEILAPYLSFKQIFLKAISAPEILAHGLGVRRSDIKKIINSCGEPEAINDNPNSAPSKRLDQLTPRFKKTTTGIEIARTIGIPKMRSACPLFDGWLTKLESLVEH